MGALAKKQAEDAAAAAAASASRPVDALATPAEPSPQSLGASPGTPAVEAAPRAASGSPLRGIALAAAIFGIAVLAWHSTPWRAPQKMKIDPESLKLDRSLDLDRPSPKGTTSPSRPS